MLDPAGGAATLPVNAQTPGSVGLTVTPLATPSSARTAAAAPAPTRLRPGVNQLPVSLDPQSQATLDQDHKLNVRVAVTFTADGGTPTTKTIDIQLIKNPSTAAPTASAAQVRKALLKILVASGKAARIPALLRSRGYRVRFRSPAAGRLTITWSSVPQRSRSKKGKTRPVLVANASPTFARPRLATVKIALTKRGRQLLKNSKRLRLTAKARFTMPHRNPVTVSKGFTIKR